MGNNVNKYIINDFLKTEYHYIENDSLDSTSHLLDCWEHALYPMLKNHSIDLVEYFYGNTNPEYYEDDGSIGLRRVEENMNRSFRTYPIYANNAMEYMDALEQIIKNNNPVAMVTMFDMLPNYKFYKNEEKGTNNHHVSLIVGFDKDNLYVIDHPDVFSKERDTFLQFNKSIHLIKKRHVLKAFEQYCRLVSLEFDKDIRNIILENKLTDIINEYYTSEFRGENAIIKCIEKLKQRENVNLVIFDIHLIYSRHVFLELMIERDENRYRYTPKLKELLSICTADWFSLKILIQRKGKADFRERQISLLEKILADEGKFICELNAIVKRLSNM